MGDNSEMLEDLTHQLRSPLTAATIRVSRILDDPSLPSALRRQLLALRGLCNKANRVAQSARLYALLNSKEKGIPVQKVTLDSSELIRMAIELAADNEIRVSPERQIYIDVDRISLQAIPMFHVDKDLLEQAINILLDNAVKYSFANTHIRVSGKQDKDHIRVEIANYGIPIHSEETSVCLQRGWRGESARLVTGEGTGIGLWIVDNIMKAHSGSVIVRPTSSAGLTSIQLVFPSH
jgi:signal transduction histidine kinase